MFFVLWFTVVKVRQMIENRQLQKYFNGIFIVHLFITKLDNSKST